MIVVAFVWLIAGVAFGKTKLPIRAERILNWSLAARCCDMMVNSEFMQSGIVRHGVASLLVLGFSSSASPP